jgi:RHS repeat-associated protein
VDEKVGASLLKDIVTDAKGSVVATGDADGLHVRGYTPYGYAPKGDSALSAIGYNGEYSDPITGDYHLGNGYRAFSPTVMRFTAPDSWAPFGSGGLNTYAYCSGNPINASDPSGHMGKWLDETLFWGTVAVLAVDAVLEGRDFYLLAKDLKQGLSSGGETAEDLNDAWDWRPSAPETAPSQGARKALVGPRGKAIAKTAWHGVMVGKDAGAAGLAIAGHVAPKSHGVAQWGTYAGWGAAAFDVGTMAARLGILGRAKSGGATSYEDDGAWDVQPRWAASDDAPAPTSVSNRTSVSNGTSRDTWSSSDWASQRPSATPPAGTRAQYGYSLTTDRVSPAHASVRPKRPPSPPVDYSVNAIGHAGAIKRRSLGSFVSERSIGSILHDPAAIRLLNERGEMTVVYRRGVPRIRWHYRQ